MQTRRRPILRYRPLAVAAALALFWSLAAAAGTQSLDQVTATVRSFVEQEYAGLGTISEVHIEALDPRLKLAACERPPQAFAAPGQRRMGNVTVGVRCKGARPWTLYVPVRIVSEVAVLTAARPLPRGAVLKPSDLLPLSRDVAALPHGYFTDAGRLIGMQLKRPLHAGDTISPAAVTAPTLVERGQQVLLRAAVDGIQISMKGEALEDGASGERIRVRNLSSRRVVEAEVIGRNQVRVPL